MPYSGVQTSLQRARKSTTSRSDTWPLSFGSRFSSAARTLSYTSLSLTEPSA